MRACVRVCACVCASVRASVSVSVRVNIMCVRSRVCVRESCTFTKGVRMYARPQGQNVDQALFSVNSTNSHHTPPHWRVALYQIYTSV